MGMVSTTRLAIRMAKAKKCCLDAVGGKTAIKTDGGFTGKPSK